MYFSKWLLNTEINNKGQAEGRSSDVPFIQYYMPSTGKNFRYSVHLR